jgi:hypothetical protein
MALLDAEVGAKETFVHRTKRCNAAFEKVASLKKRMSTTVPHDEFASLCKQQ